MEDPENPQHFPALRMKGSLSDEALQWSSEILPGCSEFFICRRRPCLTVCRNTDWPCTTKSG
eukprot:9422229-Alexandrium_andersonii.AAC.1